MGFKSFAKKAVKKSANPTKLIPGKLNPVNKIVPSKFRSFVDPMATIQKIDPTKPMDALTLGTNRLPGMDKVNGLTDGLPTPLRTAVNPMGALNKIDSTSMFDVPGKVSSMSKMRQAANVNPQDQSMGMSKNDGQTPINGGWNSQGLGRDQASMMRAEGGFEKTPVTSRGMVNRFGGGAVKNRGVSSISPTMNQGTMNQGTMNQGTMNYGGGGATKDRRAFGGGLSATSASYNG